MQAVEGYIFSVKGALAIAACGVCLLTGCGGKAKIPVELHIYGHGGHGGGIGPRKGIPFGSWHLRLVEWAKDLGYMTPAGKD